MAELLSDNKQTQQNIKIGVGPNGLNNTTSPLQLPPTTNNSCNANQPTVISNTGSNLLEKPVLDQLHCPKEAEDPKESPNNSPKLLPKMKTILPNISECIYTPCYCEENIYMLLQKVKNDHPQELDYCHVAFISNKKRMVPLWSQKSGKNEEKLAVWDYHVVLIYNPDERCVVYDLDTSLPFPTHFHKYVTETFRTENILAEEYHRFFRIIPASKFLVLFSSDRSHMRNKDGSWIKTPPQFPPILNRNNENNLENFLDMTTLKSEYGDLFNLMELVRRFYKPKQLS